MARNPVAHHAAPVPTASSRPTLRLLPPSGTRDADATDPSPFRIAAGASRPVGGAAVAVAAFTALAARVALRRRRSRREMEASRNRAFADLLTAVRQRDEALTRASHDLKTPLTALKGQAQLLQRLLRTADALDADRLRAGLAAIDAAATKAAARVDRLVDEAAKEDDEAALAKRGR